MSLYHLSAELPGGDENREKRVEIMAEGFKTALNHAATDPEIRLRMLMGEAYSKWNEFLAWFKSELAKESPEVREMAKKVAAGAGVELDLDDKILYVQRRLLSHVIQKEDAESASAS